MAENTTDKPRTQIDVYELVTQKIIKALESGAVPWQKPWAEAGVPRNLISKKPYRGINLLLLGMEEYEHNLFLTFEQANGIGGKVSKGAKGHVVVYWHAPKEQEGQTDAQEDTDTEKKRGFLRYYKVFNIGQCENIPERFIPQSRDTNDIPSCESVIEGMANKPKIQHKGSKAYYLIDKDCIVMPKKASFASDAAYYSTLFHELIHSTGSAKRLSREGITEMSEFGDAKYSLEELVAEIGTCYLQSHTGIVTEFDNSVAYMQGWLDVLKNDKRLVLAAAREAQKAVDYILNLTEVANSADVVT